jgi:hypothetical protein
MNVEIGTDATKFPEKEYLNGIFVAVHSVDLRTFTLQQPSQDRDLQIATNIKAGNRCACRKGYLRQTYIYNMQADKLSRRHAGRSTKTQP